MDLTEILKSTAAKEIGEKFGFSDEKVGSIVGTIADAVGGDKTSLLSSAASMLGESVKGSNSDLGDEIVSLLVSKAGLSESIAGSVKDMVLPIVIDTFKNSAGDKLGGLLGKFKF